METEGPWTLRGWEADGVLGQGSGGAVHAVRHRGTRAEGAVKMARDSEGAARLRAEAEVLRRVAHPHLIVLLDADDGDGTAWVVTARHGAAAAASLASGAPMSEAEVRRLGAAVLDALATLHTAGVVHRDVKPSNILRAADGRWILADLGSARTPDGALTSTGTVIGTPAFMAPEQRYGARHVGPAADLYAVGATLWALLRGEHPYELHAADARAWSGIPGDLARVLQRATRLDPADRWPTAAAMREALATAPVPTRVGRRALLAVCVAVAAASALLAPYPSPPSAAGGYIASGATLLRSGEYPMDRLGAGLVTGADLFGGPTEDVAVGSPGAGIGGRLDMFESGCCVRLGFASVSGVPGLGFGERLAALRRSAPDAKGGLLIGAPHASTFIRGAPPPLRGQAFYKPDATASFGYSLEEVYDLAFAEMGSSVDAWPRQDQAPLLAFGAPGAHAAAGTAIAMFGVDLGVTIVEGSEPAARLGEAVALADLDGDGAPELVMGAPGAHGGAGCVYAFTPEDHGVVEPVALRDAPELACGMPGEAFGASLVRAGDADGDGADEVWVGAPGGEGRVLRLGRDGVVAKVRGARPGAGFGAVVQARPDTPDALCVGAPTRATVWCFDDVATGDHDAGEADTVLGGGTPDGEFGAALGVWHDDEGRVGLLVGAPGEVEGAGRLWGFSR